MSRHEHTSCDCQSAGESRSALDLSNIRDVLWNGSGQAGLRGNLLKMSKKLDELFLQWASRWSAEEHAYPVLIRAKELAKLDYLNSFPHLATFPVGVKRGNESLRSFVESLAHQKPGQVELSDIDPIEDILTPAACYHVYIQLANSSLDAPLHVTTRNTCFRKEDYYSPLERQSAFAMREIICIGTEQEVTAFLEKERARLEAFVRKLGLPVTFEVASDPFFQPASNAKALLQRVAPSKFEMVFDNRLAIGSINYHRNYFGETFDISREGAHAYTGCVAFGIERWVSTILHHFGQDPAGWPDALRP